MLSNFNSGVILIIIGCLLLLKSLFGIQIPVFRILIGGALVYWGIMMITSMRIGSYQKDPTQENVYWGYKHATAAGFESSPKKTAYNTVFGKLELDWRKLTLEESPRRIKIHTVFGATELVLPADVPVEINMTCCFGSIDYPFGGYSAFGTKTVRLGDTNIKPGIVIDADVVFGSLSIVQSNTASQKE